MTSRTNPEASTMPRANEPTGNSTDAHSPSSVSALDAKYAEIERARLEQTLAQFRGEILPRLRALGIVRVAAGYSGYDDCGGFYTVDVTDAGDKPMNADLERHDPALIRELDDALYRLIPDGFAESHGSQGDILIDLETGTVTIAHEENYTDSRESTREFTL